jgi:hypothetical protein
LSAAGCLLFDLPDALWIGELLSLPDGAARCDAIAGLFWLRSIPGST